MSRYLSTAFIVVVVSAAWMLLPQSAFAIAVQDGLIHYWPMNEANGSVVQDSVGGANLQTQNGALLGQPGINGVGVLLDGTNDYLSTSSLPLDFLGADFTVSLWMRWSSASGKPGIFVIGPWALDLTYPDLRPQLLISAPAFRISATSSQTINDGKWHSLSVVRQGTSDLMYLDANLVGSGTGALTGSASSGTMTLGAYGTTHFFGGVIDDAAIFNRALSPTEIATIAAPEPSGFALLMLSLSSSVWRSRYRSTLRSARRN